MRRIAAVAATVIAVVAALGFSSAPVSAHPLGNFSINSASRIDVTNDAILVHFVLDMAEIPTLQERPSLDTNGDGEVAADEAAGYLALAAPPLVDDLRLTVNGAETPLRLADSSIGLPAGEAGLPTLRLELSLVAQVQRTRAGVSVEFQDSTYSDRAGYHEVIVTAGGAVTSSNAPSVSPTGFLTAAGIDRSMLPSSSRSAVFAYVPSWADSSPAGLEAPALATPAEGRAATSPLSRFIEPGALTLSTVVLLLAVALGLGAVHALEPGHGKSIVAAYFVGTRGSAAQAALLGLIVAVTHSLGVLAVAALVLFGSQYFVPEDAYPWLTMLSGGMVLLLGMALLISRTRSSGLWHRLQHLRRHGHHHEHDSDHHHHSPPQHTPERPPWKTLVLLGLVDGLIPTPSTLVVLLGAISIGRVELGLLMVVAFSTGMAVVMASISLAILGLRAVAGRLSGSLGGRQRRGARWVQRAAAGLPLGAAVVLLVIGTTIVLRGASGLSLL